MDDYGVDSIAGKLDTAAEQLAVNGYVDVEQLKHKLMDLAERISEETTSVPCDEDGTPWWIGDECVLKCGNEYERWTIVDYDVCYTIVPYLDRSGTISKLVKPSDMKRPKRPRTAEELADEMEDMAHRMQTSKGRVTPEQILQWASEFKAREDYLKSPSSI